MQRGDVYIAAGSGRFANKPAPFVIVQNNASIDLHESIIVCRITSEQTDAPFFRLNLMPSQDNGLKNPSSVSAEKVITLKKVELSKRVGHLSADEMLELDDILRFWLNL